jgi:hypothetical protein
MGEILQRAYSQLTRNGLLRLARELGLDEEELPSDAKVKQIQSALNREFEDNDEGIENKVQQFLASVRVEDLKGEAKRAREAQMSESNDEEEDMEETSEKEEHELFSRNSPLQKYWDVFRAYASNIWAIAVIGVAVEMWLVWQSVKAMPTLPLRLQAHSPVWAYILVSGVLPLVVGHIINFTADICDPVVFAIARIVAAYTFYSHHHNWTSQNAVFELIHLQLGDLPMVTGLTMVVLGIYAAILQEEVIMVA